jgi:hypothetical protein
LKTGVTTLTSGGGFSADRPLVSGEVKVLTSWQGWQPPRGVRAQ